MLEHVHAPCVLLNDSFSFFRDEFVLNDLEHFWFGFGLEPIVSVIFFVRQSFVDFFEVLRAVEVRIPQKSLLVEILLRVLQKRSLELLVVCSQILVSLPKEGVA